MDLLPRGRFGLGLAEPGSFPAATKAIGEWFPVRQRALGVGIFNAGSSLGAAVAAPLAAFLALHYGWRAAFIFTGVLGLFWVAFWLVIYEAPRRNRWLSRTETVELGELAVTNETPAAPAPVNWLSVATSRAGIMLAVARFLTDPVIYFVIFWLPAYLEKERGFSLAMIGKYAWMPYLFGAVGYLVGGWLSGRMLRAGWTVSRARKTGMAIGAGIMPVAILAPLVPSWWMAIAAMCLVVMGHAIWIANLMTLPTDLFPSRAVGTAAGVVRHGWRHRWRVGQLVHRFRCFPFLLPANFHLCRAAASVRYSAGLEIFAGKSI